MADDRPFRVARRFMATPFDLVKPPAQPLLPLEMLQGYYDALTPFIKTVGYGLFALTGKDAEDFQEVTAGALLEVIEVARMASGDDSPPSFHGQHYRDAFRALERLFNVAVPMKTKQLRKEGRRTVTETRIDFVRLLDGFGLVYLDKNGKPLNVEDARYEAFRVDVAKKFDNDKPEDATAAKRRRHKRRDRKNDAREKVWALVKMDSKSGAWLTDDEGNPVLFPPARYRFRWGREVQADLLAKPTGRGWLNISRDVFRVLRACRHANNGRGNPTAARLLELVASDLLGKGPTRQLLEKPAKLMFAALACPEPGSQTKSRLAHCDGRWSENVARVADAVRLLKQEGVLLPESDEEPFIDPNPQRRKAPYYRWKRAKEWTFTTAMEIGDAIEIRTTKGAPAKQPTGDQAAASRPIQTALFAEPPPGPRGRDIRDARNAAGLTLRDFASRFGRSIKFWSDVETEVVSRRSGAPRVVPPDIADRVAAFVAEHKPGEGP